MYFFSNENVFMIHLCNEKTKPNPRPGLLPAGLDLQRKQTVRVDFSGH